MRTRSPWCSGCGPDEQLLVEVGAVGGAEVLDHDDAALAREPGVARGRERVLEADLRLIAAAHAPRRRRRRTPCRECDRARARRSSRGSKAPAGARAGLRRRMQAGGVGRGRRSRRSARRAAAGCAGPSARCARPTAGTGRARRGSRTAGRRRPARRPRRASVDLEARVDGPDLDPVAGLQAVRLVARTSRPLTRTPLVEPRSVIVQPSPSGRSSACRRETLVSARTMSHSRLRPMRRAARRRRRSACPRPRASRGRGAALRESCSSSCARGRGRVDHRVAVVGLLDAPPAARAHEPRLDAELAQAQALVGVERRSAGG